MPIDLVMPLLDHTWAISWRAAPLMIVGLLLYSLDQTRHGLSGLYSVIEYGLGDVLMARRHHIIIALVAGGLTLSITGNSFLIASIVVTGIYLHGLADIIREPLEPSDHTSLKHSVGWLYVLTAITGLAGTVTLATGPVWVSALAATLLFAIIFWRI